MSPVSHKSLDAFENLVKKDFRQINTKRITRNNYKKQEKEAWRSLASRTDVVIQKADKGGAIVVMDKVFYQHKVNEHLADTITYMVLEQDPTNSLMKLLQQILQRAVDMGWISTGTKAYLTEDNPKRPRIYMMPKIHKDLKDPPMRPIVTGCGTIFEPLGRYIDTFLQPFVQKWKSYVKDTTDFLRKLARITSNSSVILCTIDVKSLYTSIPHSGGMEAVEWALLRQDSIGADKIFLLELLHFCLHHCYFEWDSQFYAQLTGTSMGFSGAPAYANTYMARFEDNHIYSDPDWTENCILYCRFIDDIFIVWNNSIERLMEKIVALNDYDTHIQFTHSISKTKISFLDVMIIKEGDMLRTEVYHKETDKNNALQYTSFHPPNLLCNLPYSQVLRAKRICSESEAFERNVEQLHKRYQDRGYPKEVVNAAVNRARGIPRQTLLEYSVKKDKSRHVFVSTFSTSSGSIRRSIRNRWELLQNESDFTGMFNDKPLFAYKRSQNLKELISKVSSSTDIQKHKGTRQCLNCINCNNVIGGNKLQHPQTGESISLQHSADCNTKNVVYAIKCPCGLLYVGKTERKLKIRITEHKSTIRNNNPNSSLAVHWNTARHTIAQIRFQVIEEVLPKSGRDLSCTLLRREAFWIKRLDTQSPKGINDKLDLSCFLYNKDWTRWFCNEVLC